MAQALVKSPPVLSYDKYRLYAGFDLNVLCHIDGDTSTIVQLFPKLFTKPEPDWNPVTNVVIRGGGREPSGFGAWIRIELASGEDRILLTVYANDSVERPYLDNTIMKVQLKALIVDYQSSDDPSRKASQDRLLRVEKATKAHNNFHWHLVCSLMFGGRPVCKILACLRPRYVDESFRPGERLFAQLFMFCEEDPWDLKHLWLKPVCRPAILSFPLPNQFDAKKTQRFVAPDNKVHRIAEWVAPQGLEVMRHACRLPNARPDIAGTCGCPIHTDSYNPRCVVLHRGCAGPFDFLNVKESFMAATVCKTWRAEVWTDKFRAKARDIIVDSYQRAEEEQLSLISKEKVSEIVKKFDDHQLTNWVRRRMGPFPWRDGVRWSQVDVIGIWGFTWAQKDEILPEFIREPRSPFLTPVWFTDDLVRARQAMPWLSEKLVLNEEQYEKWIQLPCSVRNLARVSKRAVKYEETKYTIKASGKKEAQRAKRAKNR